MRLNGISKTNRIYCVESPISRLIQGCWLSLILVSICYLFVPGQSAAQDGDPTVFTELPDAIYLGVDKSGVYQIDYEALRSANFDLTGTPLSDLSLTYRGEPVPVKVIGQLLESQQRSEDVFGPGAYIEFLGVIGPEQNPSRYYRLSRGSGEGSRILAGDPAPLPLSQTPVTSFEESVEWKPRRIGPLEYVTDKSLAIESNVTELSRKPRTFVLRTRSVDVSKDGKLRVQIGASTRWRRSMSGSRIVVFVNGERVATRRFNRTGRVEIEVNFPGDVLRQRRNLVSITVPEITDEAQGNRAYVEEIELSYRRRTQATSGYLQISGINADSLAVSRLKQGVRVYRQDQNGSVHHENFSSAIHSRGTRIVFNTGRTDSVWHVADRRGVLSPRIKRARDFSESIDEGAAEYLILAQPSLLGPELERLARHRMEQGLSVKTVNVEDIYLKYADGNVDSEAIQAYIQFAAKSLGTRFVLLIGSEAPVRSQQKANQRETSRRLKRRIDYSFIPTLSVVSRLQNNAIPSDALYGDADSDGIPELMVGRLPVHSRRALRGVIDKILSGSSHYYSNDVVVLVDDRNGNGKEMAQQTRSGVIRSLADTNSSLWTASLDGIDGLRRRLKDSLEQTTSVTTIIGGVGADDYRLSKASRSWKNDVMCLTSPKAQASVTEPLLPLFPNETVDDSVTLTQAINGNGQASGRRRARGRDLPPTDETTADEILQLINSQENDAVTLEDALAANPSANVSSQAPQTGRGSRNPTVPTVLVLLSSCQLDYPAIHRPSTAQRWLGVSNGGASAILGSTQVPSSKVSAVFSSILMRGLASGVSLGEAVVNAKHRLVKRLGFAASADLLASFVILGDPAMRPVLVR